MARIGKYICDKVTDWEIMQFADLVTKPLPKQKEEIIIELEQYGNNELDIQNEMYSHLDRCENCFENFVDYYFINTVFRENKEFFSKYNNLNYRCKD